MNKIELSELIRDISSEVVNKARKSQPELLATEWQTQISVHTTLKVLEKLGFISLPKE